MGLARLLAMSGVHIEHNGVVLNNERHDFLTMTRVQTRVLKIDTSNI